MLRRYELNYGRNVTMIIANAVQIAQRFLRERLSTAVCVVDATAGNGHDTLFLAQSTPVDAAIWAFDIQAQALTNTIDLLAKHGLKKKVRLINDCHSKIDCHVRQAIDVAMFNLGYLPGGDHSLTTNAATVLTALKRLLPLLAVSGALSIVAYPGHPPGRLENEAIKSFLAELPQADYSVGCWSLINQINDPPLLYLLEKKKGGEE